MQKPKKIFVRMNSRTPLNRIIDILTFYGGSYEYNSSDASAEYFRIESDGTIKGYAGICNKTVIGWLVCGYKELLYSPEIDYFYEVDEFEVVRLTDDNGDESVEIWPAGACESDNAEILWCSDSLDNCIDYVRKHSSVEIPIYENDEHDRFLHRMSRVFAVEHNPDNIYMMLKSMEI